MLVEGCLVQLQVWPCSMSCQKPPDHDGIFRAPKATLAHPRILGLASGLAMGTQVHPRSLGLIMTRRVTLSMFPLMT